MYGLSLIGCLCVLQTSASITLPFNAHLWRPDGGDARWALPAEFEALESNGFYIRAPRSPDAWPRWRQDMEALRASWVTSRGPATVRLDYRGVRAWVRLSGEAAKDLELKTGEQVRVRLEARWLSGNPELCLAFDFVDRKTGAWNGWSTVKATATVPRDGQWHTVTLECPVPPFESQRDVAVVIVGQDATRDPSPSTLLLRAVETSVPATTRRQQVVRALTTASPSASPTAIYDRRDMQWAPRNFACFFLFLYDTEVYDREQRRYRTRELLERWQRDFGGVDSVVLWQAYPRIGVDPRNQFDHYRDMPGGLPALRALVKELHEAGIRAFIAYNPWDTGTRRERVSDAQALARLVQAINADGIFLDTMLEAPPGLRAAVDRARRGVIFEPEGSPSIWQLSECSASWAQGFPEYPEPGVLLLKWLEPRHMQHQIRRWDRSHGAEIRAAFLNGSGMLIWENIFGTGNPWNEHDKAAWRRLVPVLRCFSETLSSRSWDPCIPVETPGVAASRWSGKEGDLILFAASYPTITARQLGIRQTELVDLMAGTPAASETPLKTVSVLPGQAYGELGAILIPRTPWERERVLERLREYREKVRTSERPHTVSHPPATPMRPPAASSPSSDPPAGMVHIPGGVVPVKLRHQRRECGCYADPGAPPERAGYWTWGNPFHEDIIHDYRVTVQPFYMDECLVTNGDFERFLKATGYRPAEPRNFLKHWPRGRCTPAIRDLPVVYVDLEDARAYARWAGKRLPTEAEWQLAAQGTDGRRWPWGDTFESGRCNPGGGPTPVRAFPAGRSPYGCYDMTGNVWQWTESEWSDGHTRSAIIRGGSWFEAKGSIWYVPGGPQPLDTHTRVLLMYPGLDRSETIGFRCARDAP